MILFSLFLAFLAAQSAPVGPPSIGALNAAPGHYHLISGRELLECPDLGPSRSTSQILWGCLATIFACTWTAIHPNLSGPKDSGFQRLGRQIVTMYCMIIAPELVAIWAMRQRLAAERLKKEFNDRFNNGVDPTLSTSAKVKQWFMGPDKTPRRGWTITHGFFVQMGGFVLYDDGEPVKVLTFRRMLMAIQRNEINIPYIAEEDITDKSKGDFLTKLLVVAQTTWFVIQCGIRWRLGLPLAELEVLTLAFAALNGVIYGIWLDKPQGAQVPIKLPKLPSKIATHAQTVDHGNAFVTHENRPFATGPATTGSDDDEMDICDNDTVLLLTSPIPDVSSIKHSQPVRGSTLVAATSDKVPVILPPPLRFGCGEFRFFRSSTGGVQFRWHPLEHTGLVDEQNGEAQDKGSFHMLTNEYRDAWNIFLACKSNQELTPCRLELQLEVLPFLLAMPIYVLYGLFLHPLFKLAWKKTVSVGHEAIFVVGKSRVPTFHYDALAMRRRAAILPSIAIGVIFGVFHLTLWRSPSFPTPLLHEMWKWSAVCLTVQPILVLAGTMPLMLRSETVARFVVWFYGFLGCLYIVARCIVIYIAFTTLSSLPEAVHHDIQWAALPHIY
ncbi:hypothetical protein P691DRAFT_779324 [Macrolepiota fuliginosa MF-IS2]|uniref:Uncharacterized protein n=1 Tax=Macrolepiota fuliginosa MF-IS2 TaxID=1400762 RepID=A0A9P5X398_9AGAR|nr:hypothetical protein P691DRAFT_779324 [Macrolepiota fuliginosa MF-IS2]